MKKKHLILLVAGILVLALACAIVLLQWGTAEPSHPTAPTSPNVPTEPSAPTTPSTPTEPSTPTDSTQPAPTMPTWDPDSTEPIVWPTVAPTVPEDHTHTFQKGETVAPTKDSNGYTLYVCTGCGYSYQGDIVAAITVQSIINSAPLHPTATGIADLDNLVNHVLSQITSPTDTTYDKLLAIYNYQLQSLSHKNVLIDANQAFVFPGDKTFRNAGELLIAYEAYQCLTGNGGVSDHYAAAFTVMTRAIGLESYVVSGTLNGSNHVWNNVRVGDEIYAFDAYTDTNPQFAQTELTGYQYRDREGYFAKQTGFQPADPFTVKLTVKDADGTRDYAFTWDPKQVGSGYHQVTRNTVHVSGRGDVEYTLTVVSGSSNVRLTDEYGDLYPEQAIGGSISGVLYSGGGYILAAEERNSLRYLEIQIEN